MDLVTQPNEEVVVTLFSYYGFKSFPLLKHMDPYPCTSNIGVVCQFNTGQTTIYQVYQLESVVIRFTTTAYASTPFHVLIPDTPAGQYSNYYWYHLGVYDKVTKDYSYSAA